MKPSHQLNKEELIELLNKCSMLTHGRCSGDIRLYLK